ncbi:MAG TPA: DUF3866 family protein [Acidimicrobiales bacterium]|nr:DUF3866 family protein [Acidimicrobiales bacterium]
MPSYRTGTVGEILEERAGLQRVTVDGQRSYVLTQLIGPVSIGDRVVVNTTAVDLGLGTGGWHVVHWNLSRGDDGWSEAGPGHIMKLRYTSLQVDTGAGEEGLVLPESLDGLPVVACALHSQVPIVAVVLKHLRPDARVAYVMTDGGSLPLALSDTVHQLRQQGLLDLTITAGHAFGGDVEAVNVHSALALAAHHRADVVVAGIGPGVVGTGTKLGHTGFDVVTTVDAATALDGVPILAVRFSDADERDRHHGPSHHTITAVELAGGQLIVPSPDDLDVPDVATLLEAAGLRVTTMGRGPSDDPAFFSWTGAAGVAAADLMGQSRR